MPELPPEQRQALDVGQLEAIGYPRAICENVRLLIERAETAVALLSTREAELAEMAELLNTERYALIDAEEELRRLREALRFYAKQYGLGSRLASDGGKIAREALAEVGETADPIRQERHRLSTPAEVGQVEHGEPKR